MSTVEALGNPLPLAQPQLDGRLRGELLPLHRCGDLAGDWIALQQEAACSPFSCWDWVSTWLELLPGDVRPLVFRAMDGDRVVALAVLVDAPERGLAGRAGRRCWHIQETGDPVLDEITIEYGGLLARAESMEAAYRALFEVLKTHPGPWRRLCISTSVQAGAVLAALPAGMQGASVCARPSHQVDLAAVRRAGGHAELLGRSTRSSLRQTLRAYQALGPLRVETATDAETALAWFEDFEDLHTRYWRSRGAGGCFASPFFGRFHRALLERTAGGFTRLVRVTAGDLLVGYLYNLAWQRGVYYYNGGMNYGALPRHDRPGVVSLHAIVEQAAADGDLVFDFLAGDQDYKRRLSTGSRMLHSIEVRRDGLRALAERTGTRLMRRRASLGVPLATALAPPLDEKE